MRDHENAEPDGPTGPRPAERPTDESHHNDSSNRSHRTAVPIDSIVVGETPRLSGISPEHVEMLGKVDAVLPPVLVERSTMRLIDGMHRLHAAMASGRKTIEVEFFDGPERAVFVQAVKSNIAHGLPLSLADRRAAVERIIKLYPEWSDRMVAASAGLSDKTVASIRRCLTADAPQSNTRTGLDGRSRPLNSAEGRRVASDLIEQRPHASLREVAREAGISVATVRDVRERMRRGDGPVPAMVEAANYARSNGNGSVAGPARHAAGDRKANGAAPELDCSSLLEGLKTDPSLRYNEVGRALLRWLDLRTIRTKELHGIADQVPPHAAVIVAKVARRCAAVWENLANELELRSHDPSSVGYRR